MDERKGEREKTSGRKADCACQGGRKLLVGEDQTGIAQGLFLFRPRVIDILRDLASKENTLE